jgi:alkylhydroperoxidase/carboxymuconolactone decarboxylase family protein YurZ
MTVEEDPLALLAAARARRGYLLPHHGLFVLLSPRFATAYEEAYGTLALQPVSLPAEDKEFVWVVITAVVGSATARHHVRRYREAGGGTAGVETALRIAAFAMGRNRFDFAAAAWRNQLPGWDAGAAERAARDALLADTGFAPRRVALGLLAAATALDDAPGLTSALRAAHAAGVAERDMAEAMCLTVQPAGLPRLVRAAGTWRALIRAGDLPASDAFKAWAESEAEGD